MLTAKEFDQLIAVLPHLEAFARDRQLTSLSLIKNPFHRKATDLYLCYTHLGDIHGVHITARIGLEFEKLWGVPVDSDIVLPQDRKFFDNEIFDQHLKASEFFLVSMDVNQNYITATPAQVVDYARREFEITIHPSDYMNISENSRKRKSSDEKTGADQTSSLASNNIFMKVSPQNSVTTIDEQIDNLSLDECKQYLRYATNQLGLSNLNLLKIRPVRK